jgi:hypothetical protein
VVAIRNERGKKPDRRSYLHTSALLVNGAAHARSRPRYCSKREVMTIDNASRDFMEATGFSECQSSVMTS